MVAADETEQGERALLNLGHTFGHAFESLTDYDLARLVHGEGVAIGMASAFRFSRDLGLCSGQDATRVEAHLKAIGLPTRMRRHSRLRCELRTIFSPLCGRTRKSSAAG